MKLLRTPWRWAYMPLRIEARLGEQSDVVQNAFLKWTPCLASRSRFGVLRCLCPAQLMQSQRMSSVMTTITFGFFLWACTGCGSRPRRNMARATARLVRGFKMVMIFSLSSRVRGSRDRFINHGPVVQPGYSLR